MLCNTQIISRPEILFNKNITNEERDVMTEKTLSIVLTAFQVSSEL
jgi:hypothetical protein